MKTDNPLILLHDKGFLFTGLQSWVSEANDHFVFPVLINVDAQGQLISQYEGTDFSHMQEMKKPLTVYGLHSPFTEELLNAMASSTGNFIPMIG